MNGTMRVAGDFGTLSCLSLAALLSVASVTAAGAEDRTEAVEETLFFDSREDIPLEHRWDVAAILADRAAWEAARKNVEAALPGLDKYRGHLGESAEALAAALRLSFDTSRRLDDVYVYAGQSLHTQMGDADAQGLFAGAQALLGSVQEATAFIDPEIARIPPERLAGFKESAALEPYRHYIDNVVRTREHILSPEIEQVLAGAGLPGAAYSAAAQSLEGSDIEWPTLEVDGEDLKVVPGQYSRLVTDADREVRRDASLALFRAYTRFANTFAATLRGSIQRDVWLARTRGYETTLDMALDSTNVPRSVVDTLVGTVRDNIDAIQGYGKLRKRMLGLEELHIYDMYVNLLPDIDRQYTPTRRAGLWRWSSGKRRSEPSTRRWRSAPGVSGGSTSTRTRASGPAPTPGAPTTRTRICSSTGTASWMASRPWSTRWGIPSTATWPRRTRRTTSTTTASSWPRWRR